MPSLHCVLVPPPDFVVYPVILLPLLFISVVILPEPNALVLEDDPSDLIVAEVSPILYDKLLLLFGKFGLFLG